VILSDHDIHLAVYEHRIHLDPLDLTLVQPASIDVRLDHYFRVFDAAAYTHIDPKVEHPTKLVEVIPGQPFVLHPGEFALGSTSERLSLDGSLAARLEGKSSLARLGLLTHATAGFIDPGFSGQITLELASVSNLPLLLWPGMKIGQLCFMQLSSPAKVPYGELTNHYQGQRGPTPSRSYLQFD
jgi:dCTP deaminase